MLFQKIELVEDGRLNFYLFRTLQHHIFLTQQNFYTLKLRESMIKSKYNNDYVEANEANDSEIEIQSIMKGTVEEFKEWFLGKKS